MYDMVLFVVYHGQVVGVSKLVNKRSAKLCYISLGCDTITQIAPLVRRPTSRLYEEAGSKGGDLQSNF